MLDRGKIISLISSIAIFILSFIGLLVVIILDRELIIFNGDFSKFRELSYVILIIIYLFSFVIFQLLIKDNSYKFKFISILVLAILTFVLLLETFDYKSEVINGNALIFHFYCSAFCLALMQIIISIGIFIYSKLKVNFKVISLILTIINLILNLLALIFLKEVIEVLAIVVSYLILIFNLFLSIVVLINNKRFNIISNDIDI